MDHKEKYNKAVSLVGEKKCEEALQLLNELEIVVDNIPDYYFLRGVCNFNTQRVDAATIDLEKALVKNPTHPEAPMLLGNIYYSKGLYSQAVESFSRAILYDEGYNPAIYWRLVSRLQIKDANGKLINREGAQADADKLTPVADQFFAAKKDGKILHIVALKVTEDGQLDFDVLQ